MKSERRLSFIKKKKRLHYLLAIPRSPLIRTFLLCDGDITPDTESIIFQIARSLQDLPLHECTALSLLAGEFARCAASHAARWHCVPVKVEQTDLVR